MKQLKEMSSHKLYNEAAKVGKRVINPKDYARHDESVCSVGHSY